MGFEEHKKYFAQQNPYLSVIFTKCNHSFNGKMFVTVSHFLLIIIFQWVLMRYSTGVDCKYKTRIGILHKLCY
jgi:hypothetical protein